MIYVIGGAQRSGKSSLAQLVAATYGIPFAPLDALTAAHRSTYARQSAGAVSGQSALATLLAAFVDDVTRSLPNYCLEGTVLTPPVVAALAARIPLQAAFLGRERIDGSQLRVTSRGQDDWLLGRSDAEVDALARRLSDDSRRIRSEAARFGYPYFDTSVGLYAVIEDASDSLVSATAPRMVS